MGAFECLSTRREFMIDELRRISRKMRFTPRGQQRLIRPRLLLIFELGSFLPREISNDRFALRDVVS